MRGDCRDKRVVAELVPAHDETIPLAALVGAPLRDRDPIAAATTIRGGLELLLKHARPEQRFLYAATNGGYGIGRGGQHAAQSTTRQLEKDVMLQGGGADRKRLDDRTLGDVYPSKSPNEVRLVAPAGIEAWRGVAGFYR